MSTFNKLIAYFLATLAFSLVLPFNFVFAAAPTITNVEVSQTSVSITFDQAVTNADSQIDTGSARNLNNYTLQAPTGTANVLSARSRYNHFSDYNSSLNRLRIYGLNLTQGQPASLVVQNIRNLSSEAMVLYNASTTVTASSDPRVDTITRSDSSYPYAKTGDNLTVSGVNFGSAGSIRIENASTTIVSWSSTSIAFTVPASLSSSTVPKNLTVYNSTADRLSVSRPFALYDSTYGVLKGIIKDSDGTTVLSNIEVYAYKTTDPWNRYQVQTQTNGAFALAAPAGTYTVEAITNGAGSSGAAPSKSTGYVATANAITDVGTITFVAPTITGTVVAADGVTPVYGAIIRARNDTWTIEKQALTGVNGSYKVFVPVASSVYTLDVEPSDYDKQVRGYLNTSTTSIASSPAAQTNITLATLNVTGTVKTPTGATSDSNPFPDTAVPSANVHIYKSDWTFDRWTSTDDAGNFSFAGVPNGANYTLEFEAAWCGDSRANVAKFCVYSRTRFENVAISGITNLNTSTQAASGALRFATPNFFGAVYVDANSNSQYNFTDSNSNGKCDSGETGEGLQGAWVNMNKEGYWTGGQTDACGRYSFALPATGRYFLDVQPNNSSYASVNAEITVDTLPIALPYNIKLSTPNVTGFVYGPTGSGEASTGQQSTWLDTCPKQGPGRCYGGSADQSGAFSINVPDGTWQLQIHTNWNSVYVAPSPYILVVASGALTTVNSDTNDADEPFTNQNKVIIRLIDPANDPKGFTGTVYDPTGVTAQSNVGVGLRPAEAQGTSCVGTFSGDSRWTQTNSLGKFAFGDVESGLYEIEITPWGSSQYSRTSKCWNTATQGRNPSINLTSPNITGVIKTPTGSVTNDNPTPNTAVAFAWVSLFQEGAFGPGGGWFGGNTNSAGQFSLGGVPAGTYALEIHPSWGSAYSTRKLQGITITAQGNCTTGQGGDQDNNASACDLNTLAGVGDGAAVRLGLPQIKGQIVDPNNSPVQFVWVMVHDQIWTNNAGGETDESGNFKLGGLADGTYQIEINLPWGTSQALVAPSGLAVTISSGAGSITQNGTALTNNKIQLQVPQKTLTGRVYKDLNNNSQYNTGEEVAGARVEAHKDMGGGFFETKTGATGTYTLKLSGGAWWIEVRPDWGNTEADWINTESPKRLSFNEDNTAESKEQNFVVSATNATITGVIKTPTGSAVQYAWVDVRGKGVGNSTSTDSQGRFSIRVPAGTYKIHVFPGTSQYGSPDPKIVNVAANETVDAGTLVLKERNASIKGFVVDDSGNPVQNVIINAWQFEGAGWANAYTDTTGAYTVTISSGSWGVAAMPMSQNYVVQGSAKKILVKDNETSSSNNFTLKVANKTLKVKVKDTAGNRITDVWGGVWLRDTAHGSMLDFGGPMQDMMQKAGMIGSGGGGAASATPATGTATGAGSPMGPGMERGGFAGGGLVNGYTEIKVPAGTYEIGLGMPPGSRYTLQATKTVTFAAADTSKEVDVTVLANNATISGKFYLDADNDNQLDTGEAITGMRAFINADKSGGGWQYTESGSDGAYTLQVSAGEWYLDAFIDPLMTFGTRQYMVANADAKITIAANGTATFNFKVKALDATITGTVRNPNGTAMTEGLVWVFADYGSSATLEDFEGAGGPGLGVFSATDGTYSLKVPAGTYKIGAGIPPWETRDLLNPNLKTVTVASGATSTGNDLQFKQSDATLSGNITLNGNKQASFVRAWSDNGRGGGTVSLDGTYRLPITQNDTWHLFAAAEINNAYYESNEVTLITASSTASYSQDFVLVSRNISVPEGITATFDASQAKTVRLTKLVNGSPKDEVVMEIPAGAIETSGTITVSITPTVNTKPDAKDKPIGLGYDFEARKSDGTEVESFIQNITIYIYYDENFIRQDGYAEESITPKYFDDRTGSWENYDTIIRDTANNVLIIKTDHFSVGGITGGGAVPNAPSGLTATVSGTSVQLAWADNSTDETGFKILRGSTLLTTTAANVASYTDSGLAAGTYTYQVKATNAAGDSASASATVAVTGGGIVQPTGGSAPSGGGGSTLPATTQVEKKSTKTETKPVDAAQSPSEEIAQKTKEPMGRSTLRDIQIQRIISEAKKILGAKVSELLALVNAKRDIAKEQKVDKGLTTQIIGKLKVKADARTALTNFISYGTPESKKLGDGERAGVVDSFKDAFGRVPQNEKDWEDVLKIAVGRFPSQKSAEKEKLAEVAFKKIYGHMPNRKDSKEDAAVTIMAYGLRPGTRNTTSEKQAILSYRAIFKKDPKSAKEWNQVRAIAYSGATREVKKPAQTVNIASE